ncbi:MAG: type II toxin-antitoxin system Phd/YefM family antitoxin [Aestuariivita sp.]|nr:type II toxin-antitoxin system Phd/YefM family antitoxin [Aestuariivita sp.]MCY4347485.1 type II toxin-antitoxin system Phd/YefM family antitoxin [Aestuariivita sp.]
MLYINVYSRYVRSASCTDLQENLATFMDDIAANREPILITRGNGKPRVMMTSLEDFSSYEETRHLLSGPNNTTRLLKAVKELESGHGTERKLED